jgi:hypothetical protein
MEIFFGQKVIYILKLSIFVEKLSTFFQLFRVVLLHIHFGLVAPQIRNDLFRIRIWIRILLIVSDPTGSATLR